ncbi:putative peptidase [Podospora australis]|uniref:Peptidase n=1 Tax=Podospora australis TaxID=1536484 RepID=A0AAN6WPW4_9PEZI|nr:putative peptidase [Podospora australis]
MHFLTVATLLTGSALAAPLREAPILQPRGVAALIPNSYIVKLKDGASDATLQNTLKGLKGVSAEHLYKGSKKFKGFAAKLSGANLDAVRKLPEVCPRSCLLISRGIELTEEKKKVEYIEQDAVVQAYDFVTQDDVPWGLARISHRTTGQTSYVYDESAGEGTCSYIIDTGVYVNHTQFGGRAEWLANFADTDNTDGNGHGTHCAGTIGGADFGVAKKTKLFAVKVLRASGSGTLAGVIAGIDFVASDAATRGCPKGATANLSLGSSRSTAVNAAAAAAVRAGVFLSVAAGNYGDDSFFYSPASEPTVCTVGATDISDARAWFSNYGDLVDVFAPGVDVLSSWIGNPTATVSFFSLRGGRRINRKLTGRKQNIISGTSMAAPHVAGLASYLLGLLGPQSPEQLCAYIRNTSTPNTITDLPEGTFNGIAFNGNPAEL